MQHHCWSRGSFGHCEGVGFWEEPSELVELGLVGLLFQMVVSVRILGCLNIVYHSFRWTISMLESFFGYFSLEVWFQRFRCRKVTRYKISWGCAWHGTLQFDHVCILLHLLKSAFLLYYNPLRAKWLTWLEKSASATHMSFSESIIVHSNILGIQNDFAKGRFHGDMLENKIRTSHKDSW